MPKTLRAVTLLLWAVPALVLTGWFLGVEALKSVVPGYIAMNPLTALCFVALGGAIRKLEKGPNRAGHVLALTVMALAALRLCGYATPLDPGLDQILFSPSLGANRMAPNTAFCLLSLGGSLLLLDRFISWRWHPSQLMAAAAAFIGLLALTGYGYGINTLYGIGMVPMALHTATLTMAAGLGVLILRPDRGYMPVVTSEDAAGLLARRLLPASIAIPATLGFLRIQGQRAGLYPSEFGTALFALATTVMFFGLILWLGTIIHDASIAQRRLERRVRAQHAVSGVLTDSRDVRTAYEAILSAMAIPLGWDMGVCWLVVGEKLRASHFWVGNPALEWVREAAKKPLTRGESFAGSVWANDRPAWQADFGAFPHPMTREAAQRGLKSAMAFPVRAGGEVVAVFVFGAPKPKPVDSAMLQMLQIMGTQIGQFVERSRVEEARAYLASIVETSSDAVYTTDLAGTVRSWNAGAEKLFGWSSSEVIGRSAALLIPSQDELGLNAHLERVRSGSGIQNLETMRCSKEGRPIDVSLTVSPVLDNGQVAGASFIARDITERKRLEYELERARDEAAEQARLITNVVENMADGLSVANEKGEIILVNPAGKRITGLDDHSGKGPETWPDVFGLFHLDGKTPYKAAEVPFARAIQGEDVPEEELILKKPSHPEGIYITVTARPLRDLNGKPRGAVAVYRDSTLKKQAELAIAKARDAALEAASAKASFLANMSHEIRTPMNAIIGMTDLLLDTALAPRQRDFARTVKEAGESLLGIINDILDFSKLEAGKVQLENLDFDPADVLEGALELFAHRASSKGLELTGGVDPGVPSWVSGDPGRLRQVVTNLLGNALKFTEKGEVSVRVSPAGEKNGLFLARVSVHDTGIGLSQEERGRIFAAFAQADVSTTRKYGGTGLGLAISKELVGLMGGELGVDSEPGKGSTFWFTLTLGKPATAQPRLEGGLAGMSVLICDDNATNRELLTHQLAAWNMRCAAVAGGKEALKALEKDAFDFLLLDMQMPGMDGLEVAKRVKAAGHKTKVVLLTSMSQTFSASQLAEAGLSAALTKPARRSSLLDAMSTAVGVKVASKAIEKGRDVEPHTGFRILLVEDNAVNREVALRQLESLGYAAQTVNNGREALEKLEAERFDLILMDCQMPVMDGFEATRELRRREKGGSRHTPVVAMTANALEGDRKRCLDAGMDDYLSKPVRAGSLAAVLSKYDLALDPTVLAGIQELDPSPAFLKGLLEQFLKDAYKHLDEMEQGELEASSHALKGSSGTIGAKALESAAARVEKLARKGKKKEAQAAVKDLRKELERTEKALREKLA
jgi:PAS domain S-box-containing protein